MVDAGRPGLLWIDARERRVPSPAARQAALAFEIVPTTPGGAAATGAAHLLAIEFDPDRPQRIAAVCAAVAAALGREPETRGARLSAIEAAVAYIEAHLAGPVSLDAAAHVCRLSACELSRRFHRERGETFSAYVVRRRVERAQALLAAGDCSVSAAAYAAGFNDLSYFARVFRRRVGMPASAYQARIAPKELVRPAARSSQCGTSGS